MTTETPQEQAPDTEAQETAPEATPAEDVNAQLATMQSQLQELQAQAKSGQLTSAPVDSELAARVDEKRKAFEDWPQKGDKFADTPQPHDLGAHGLPQPGVNRDHLPPGEPDTVSPVVVSHSLPTIGPGHAGQPVSLLAKLLAKLGYPTTISRGQNHTYSFDDSVTAAVDSFKREWHVIEDSTGFRTAEEAARVVGPWIWEALLRATRTL